MSEQEKKQEEQQEKQEQQQQDQSHVVWLGGTIKLNGKKQ